MKAGHLEYEVHNYMEDVVEEVVQELLAKESDICSCSHCVLDMSAIVLNQISPKYLPTVKEPSQLDDDQFTALLDTVYQSIDKVKKNPRHNERSETQDYQLRNHSEAFVNRVLTEILGTCNDILSDPQYIGRIAAISLNTIQPRYALTTKGESYLRIAELEHQYLPTTMVAVYQAIKAVANENPTVSPEE